jgi:preprotein translocase subunit SecD
VRSLLVLLGLLTVLYGAVAAGVHWDKAQWTPKLALDLEGGTEIVLSPQPVAGKTSVDPAAVDESVNIIRQRVNGSGISEAEVTRQGQGADTKIIVDLPGKPDQNTIQLVEQSAQLQFRAVLQAEQVGLPAPSATGTPTPSSSGAGTPSSRPSASSSSKASQTAKPSPTSSSNGMNIPKALTAVSPTPTPTASPLAKTSSGGSTASGSASPAATPTAKPTDASDPNWVTPQLQQQFDQTDCTNPEVRQKLRLGGQDPNKPFITCAEDGREKYILGPAELVGTDVTGATAGLETNSQGFTGSAWQVNLNFSGQGAEKFGKVTSRLSGYQTTDPTRNRFAIVLDNLVVSAPSTNEAITTGSAVITGNFTQATAQNLANQLKYGALPVSFRVETTDQISPTLGSDNLKNGLLAGLLGLVLVVLYSLLQYRALGLVTVGSLVVAGAITYGFVLLLGWREGFRLSLPGVTGLVVAIGITADSFIVYFERVRDEVREGRSLQAAVEAGWGRARRTVLASDTVSFLAALVLYILAIGSVRGFAFTLGLTTIVDVIVVFLFTKPVVTLLARTKFFGGGHKLSGFDAAHLGRSVAYAGRGRVRTPSGATPAREAAPAARQLTLAERRAERERAAGENAPPDAPDRVEQTTTSGRES